ncbi:glycosyltransferase family 2 protein [Limosilactobacillus vaginalis]|uniref:glycosyltransferase family 2 protein n=1 Tax=Limosilactobacillus vaginalis TaxID=1633 RepID=UPI00360E90A8
MYKVSIIIPVFNAMPYLRKCLYSVLHQNFDDYEVIIVNDGSNDGSKELIEKVAAEYKNVKVINQRNQGLYISRQRGLEVAKGKYIGWVDADDFVSMDMFKTLYDTAVSHDSDLVYCDYNFYPHKINTKEKWFRPFRGIKDINYVERNNQPWNKIVKKDLLDKLQISRMFLECFDEAYIKVLLNAKNPISINDKLYFYRVGVNSISTSYKNVNHYKKFISASMKLKWEMRNESLYWTEYFNYRIIYYYLITMLVAANANEKQEYLNLRNSLRKSTKFKKNKYLKQILKKNFGSLRSFAIENLIVFNFYFTRILAKLVFK